MKENSVLAPAATRRRHALQTLSLFLRQFCFMESVISSAVRRDVLYGWLQVCVDTESEAGRLDGRGTSSVGGS